MNKHLYIIVLSFLFIGRTYCQISDSLFSFYPEITKGAKIVKSLDLLFLKKKEVHFQKDSTGNAVLNVSVFEKNNRLKCRGKYKLNGVDTTYILVLNRTGDKRKIPKAVEYKYMRDGYWTTYTKHGKEKEVYFYQGKVMKVRMP